MADGSSGRSFRVPFAWVWPALWVGLVTVAGLATTYVFATKGELADHNTALVVHAKEERETTAKIETEAAASRVLVDQHGKTLDKLERFIEAVDANQRTMMLDAGIPSGRIRRPKEE